MMMQFSETVLRVVITLSLVMTSLSFLTLVALLARDARDKNIW